MLIHFCDVSMNINPIFYHLKYFNNDFLSVNRQSHVIPEVG